GAGVAAAAPPGGEHERAECLGWLALVEALRGRLRRAAKLATEATAALAAAEQQPPAQRQLPVQQLPTQHLPAQPLPAQQFPVQPQAPAALAALAWVHLERGELREAR